MESAKARRDSSVEASLIKIATKEYTFVGSVK